MATVLVIMALALAWYFFGPLAVLIVALIVLVRGGIR